MTIPLNLLRVSESRSADESADEAIQRRDQRRRQVNRQMQVNASEKCAIDDREEGQKLLDDVLRRGQTDQRANIADSKFVKSQRMLTPTQQEGQQESQAHIEAHWLLGDKDVQAYLKNLERESNLSSQEAIARSLQNHPDDLGCIKTPGKDSFYAEPKRLLGGENFELNRSEFSEEETQNIDQLLSDQQHVTPPLSDLDSAAEILIPDRRMIQPESLLRRLENLRAQLKDFFDKRDHSIMDEESVSDALAQHQRFADSLEFLEGYAEASHDASTMQQTVSPAIELLRAQVAVDRSLLQKLASDVIITPTSQQAAHVTQAAVNVGDRPGIKNRLGPGETESVVDEEFEASQGTDRSHEKRIAERVAERHARAEAKDKEIKDQTLPLIVQRSV